MSVQSKWLVILIGNNDSGKTTLQKELVKLLSSEDRDYRLDCNLVFDITHPNLIRKLKTFSIGNRSYQERSDYESVQKYFAEHFADADLCFISSHLDENDIQAMIDEGHSRFYNVCGLFFTNSIQKSPTPNASIAKLPWDERWTASNEVTEDKSEQNVQLRAIAASLVQMLIERTRGW